MLTQYKILYEVRLLHEFYLTEPDGASIFDLPAVGRENFLHNRLSLNARNIMSDFYLQLPEPTRALFRSQRLHLLPTYSGFRVAVQVKPVTIAGPLTAFEPLVPLPADLSIPVLLMRRSADADMVTSARLQRNMPGVFYFSGEPLPDAKTAPFLANPVSAFNGGYTYEQGELALHAPNDIRAFYTDEMNADQWLSVVNGGYANENDRLLVKPDFFYQFQPADGVNDASFVLKDHTNAVVITLKSKLNTGNFTRVPLSFDILKLKYMIPETPANNTLLYTLTVTGNGGYNKTHKLIFLRDLQTDMRNVWGMVHLKIKSANAAFSLTDANDRLQYKLNPDKTVNTAAPVFEVWVKSRLPFWRYTNDRRKDLKMGIHPDFLYFDGGKLITKTPKTLSYSPLLFKKPDNSLHYLPNPKLFDTLKTEGRRIYADITVPESQLFPLGP